jgi:glutamate racemase
MCNFQPIGFFDSGIGGLTVWREVTALLPRESTVYVADTAHCPYGHKAQEELVALSRQCVEMLLGEGCKLIVIACNTATAAAIDVLREGYPAVPFIGMEPAVKPAALNTRTGVIGVLATEGTFNGRLFKETSARFASHVTLEMCVGNELVELVDSGKAESGEAYRLLERLLKPMLDKNIDHLVLGCTHFPFLRPHIERIVGGGVAILDPAPAVARHAERLLIEKGMVCYGGIPAHTFIKI